LALQKTGAPVERRPVQVPIRLVGVLPSIAIYGKLPAIERRRRSPELVKLLRSQYLRRIDDFMFARIFVDITCQAQFARKKICCVVAKQLCQPVN